MKIERNSQILILIVIVVITFILLGAPKVTQEPSRSGIVISAYDAEGNLLGQMDGYGSNIFSRVGLQSVYDLDTSIQLPAGTKFIKYNVTVENTGNVIMNANYVSGILETP